METFTLRLTAAQIHTLLVSLMCDAHRCLEHARNNDEVADGGDLLPHESIVAARERARTWRENAAAIQAVVDIVEDQRVNGVAEEAA